MIGGSYGYRTWLFNATDNSLTQKNDMNIERSYFAIAYDVQNKEIYVFGGYYGNILKSCEKYSIENNLWTEIAPL